MQTLQKGIIPGLIESVDWFLWIGKISIWKEALFVDEFAYGWHMKGERSIPTFARS